MPNWISGGLLCPETESITDRGHHFALGNNNVWDSARISDFHSSSVLFWCFRISPLTLPGYSYLLYHLFYANKSCRSNSVLNLFFFFFTICSALGFLHHAFSGQMSYVFHLCGWCGNQFVGSSHCNSIFCFISWLEVCIAMYVLFIFLYIIL